MPPSFYAQVQCYAFSLVTHDHVRLPIYFPFVSLNRHNTSRQIAYIFHDMASNTWFVFGKWRDSFFKLIPLKSLSHISPNIDNLYGIIFAEDRVSAKFVACL